LTARIKERALELGFVRVGITTPDPFPEYANSLAERHGYERWTAKGSESELVAAADPHAKIPEAKSVISLVYSFGHLDFPEKLTALAGRTYLARCYNPKPDTVNGQRLVLFKDFLRTLGITPLDNPNTNMQLPDRSFGARAGVTTFGRNNFAYAGKYGSFIILSTIPVDTELEMEVHETQRPCPPDCRRCIEACPTCAMDEAGNLDPSRCVLYNNLFPNELRDNQVADRIGTRIHGCDECQLACPRNHQALSQPRVKDPLLERLAEDLRLEDVLFCDEDYYQRNLRPIMYNYIADIDVFRRNAATAMGNSGNADYLPFLERAAKEGSKSVRAEALRAIEKLQ
ncbi:MAG: epoxyqueuosine reductase, partial [Eggerthellaceae bacterium]|nr:epoxyqueuosine reductase [Eggerthellaceae bacterium]